MHRARTRVLVAPEWSSKTTTNATYGPGAEPSLRARLSQLVSDGAVSQDGDRTGSAAELPKLTESGLLVDTSHLGGNALAAVAPSPGPEPAASASVTHQVLYPPPVPPYAPVRSAWPEAALVDLIKQQALFPTDVNLRVGCPALGGAAARGASLRAALRAISEEAQASVTAAPASASFQFVQLLAELCSRAGSTAGASAGGQLLGDVGQGGCGGSQGPGPGWRRPPAPAPALALAAAASGRAPVPQLEAAALGAPAALVGFESDWLAVQPAVLPCWDKVSLEPCGPPKPAQYYVVCGEQHSSAARMFVRDVSATFLAMRLGTHTAGRTPAHLHSIDGVIPVPLDPGPGPPPPQAAAADGNGGAAAEFAAAAAAATAALSWHPLARRPDPSVMRSAVLGFRSNHATASVAGDPAWTPDEPCYRPRPQAAVAASVGGAQAPAAGGLLSFYWRNLRHVARQLQRHLLLQQPQQDPGRCGGGGGAVAAADQQQQADVGPPALVVYVVPPSDAEEDVVRALMEVCACLAPVTPAARAPPAAAPLAAPPAPGRRDGDTAAAVAVAGAEAQQRRQSLSQQPDQLGCRWTGEGCNGGGAAASAPTGQDGSATAAPPPPTACSGSAASTPPEPPACSSTSGGAAAAAASSSSASSGPLYGGGGGGDATDPGLLARLGGAARHLYRSASCCPAGTAAAAVAGGGSGTSAPGWQASPQLDLPQLAAMDLTVQVVLPSSLQDITGASVRATACAAYSKLCRRRAGYGAAAAAINASAASNQQSAAVALTMSASAPGMRGDGGGGDGSCADGRCVASSCSGRTTLYEPLIALAPLTLQATADDDAAAALPPPPPLPQQQQRGLSPSMLREGSAVSSPQHAQQRQQHEYGNAAPPTAAAVPPPLPPPTLHGCYAWWRCPQAAGLAAAALGRCGLVGGRDPPPQQQRQQLQRCWLAMAFCDVEGKVLDARALELCFDAPGETPPADAAAGGAAAPAAPPLLPHGAVGVQPAAALPPSLCSCRADGSVNGGGGANGAVHGNMGLGGRCQSGGAAAAAGTPGGGVGTAVGVPPEGWGQQPSLGQAVAQQRPLPPAPTGPAAATSLDALVCRTVLGHARLLSRQLAEAHSSDVAAVAAGASCTDAGVSAGGGLRRRGQRVVAGALVLAKLGPPTAAEAAEWHALLQPSAGGGAAAAGSGERRGSGASLRRRWDQASPHAPPPSATSEPAVTLAWLEPHMSVATQAGCRLPQGGFAVAGPADLPQPLRPSAAQHTAAAATGGGGGGGARESAAVTLVAFPAQRPPSASCAAAEALNRHLRLLSVHPFPRCQPPQPQPPQPQLQSPPATAMVGATASVTGPALADEKTSGSAGPLANGPTAASGAAAGSKRPAACSPAHSPGADDGAAITAAAANGPEQQAASGCQHQHKRRRWGERVDGGVEPPPPAAAWSEPGWSTLRDLYGLCLLRDWLLAAQSGARGGPTPGRRQAAAAVEGGGDWDFTGADVNGGGGGSDAPLLLPLHAAVCRQLLRILVACEQLVVGS